MTAVTALNEKLKEMQKICRLYRNKLKEMEETHIVSQSALKSELEQAQKQNTESTEKA